MKRLFSFVLILVIGISSTACKKDESINVTQKIKDNFETIATIKYGGNEAVAKITKNNESNYVVEMQSPTSLSGLAFTFNDEDIEISYMGMSIHFERDNMMATAISEGIINSINTSINSSDVQVETVDDTYVLSGENESGAFQLALDKKTKEPVSLSIPSLNMECTFKSE